MPESTQTVTSIWEATTLPSPLGTPGTVYATGATRQEAEQRFRNRKTGAYDDSGRRLPVYIRERVTTVITTITYRNATVAGEEDARYWEVAG